MPEVTLQVSPTGSGDLQALMFTNAAAPLVGINPTSMGQFDFLAQKFAFGQFFRFESTVPVHATLTGVNFEWTVAPNTPTQSAWIQTGFLKSDGLWNNADGFANSNYPSNASLPSAERHEGADVDPTVWHDDAPGWPGDDATTLSTVASTRVTYGDGDLSPDVEMTGLLAQLQSYLDANEALRGSVQAGAVPVAWHMLFPWAKGFNQFLVARQFLWHSEVAFPTFRPALTISYTEFVPDPPAALDADMEVSPATTSSATMRESVEGPVHARARVTADIKIRGR
jgi:hypothetical protein